MSLLQVKNCKIEFAPFAMSKLQWGILFFGQSSCSSSPSESANKEENDQNVDAKLKEALLAGVWRYFQWP